jgi:hypothetical protein
MEQLGQSECPRKPASAASRRDSSDSAHSHTGSFKTWMRTAIIGTYNGSGG